MCNLSAIIHQAIVFGVTSLKAATCTWGGVWVDGWGLGWGLGIASR